MTKDEKRARLAEIDARIEANDAALRRVAATELALRDRLDEEREDLLADDEIAGKCEGCGTVLFFGDRGHQCNDFIVLCENCSPTFGDLKSDAEKALRDAAAHTAHFSHGEDWSPLNALDRVAAHIAAGGQLTDKLVGEL